jgi:hypothetical protein
MPPSRRAVALLAALGAAACAADDGFEIPPVVWSGEHLDYAPQAHADPVCAGTLPYMDRFMELAAAEMDVALGRAVFIHGSLDDAPFCEALGCHQAGIIYSRRAPHEHELVHAVRGFVGTSHGFFEEGAAEMLGGDDDMNPNRVPAEGDLREGLDAARPGTPLPDAWYPRAGHFSAYLHQHHGPHVTNAILRETTSRSSTDDVIAVLEHATAMPFDDLIADYEHAEGFCDKARWYRYPLYPCDAPEALRPRCDGEVAVPIEETLSCDDPDSLGPRENEVFKYVAFEVPTDGMYSIVRAPRAGADVARIDIKGCELGCRSVNVVLPHDDPIERVHLRAGRYSMRLTRRADVDTPTSMSIKITGDDCR